MNSFSSLIQSEAPVLVDFYATWCGPCKTMEPMLKELKDKLGPAVRIVKIDVDKNQAVSATFGVQAVPTLILFKKGRVLWRQSGVVPVTQLEQIIRMHT
jgi:thioredoxin 1